MHNFWFFFLRKREFSWLLIFALIAMGVYAAFVIPKESAPEVIVPIGIVTTVYPGASSLDMEELVTNKLEQDIANLDNIDSVTSTSRDGISMITASFDASADIDTSLSDLKDVVTKARSRLPKDAQDPLVSEVNFENMPILTIAVSSSLPPAAFTELADQVVDELKSVRGVSDVIVSGTRENEVEVIVSERSLLAYGKNISDVTQSLASSNLTMPIGSVTTDGVEYAIRFEGKIDDVNEIGSIPLGTFGGTPVYVRDVAMVKEGVKRETSISRVSIDGSPSEAAFTLSVFKKAGFDVTEMADAVHEKLNSMKQEGGSLEGAQVLIVFDQADQVKKDLRELIHVGFETVALVVLCLLLTIGWRESLVAALSIPLSFVIAFIGLYASGNTINFISLFALILAIGILVDSGIVITEAIHTRSRKLGSVEDAASLALKEYAWPLIAGTMTTVAVFAPLFFLSGIVGEFIKSIPFTLIFVLIASIVVALGMVPLIATYLTHHGKQNRIEEKQEEYTRKAQEWYKKKIIAFLHNARAQRVFLITLTVAFFAVLTFPVLGFMKVVFFPAEDVDYIFIEVEAPQGTPLRDTDLSLRKVEEILYEEPVIDSFTTTVGSGSSFTGSTNSGSKYGNIMVSLDPTRKESSADIAEKLREKFKDIKSATISITEQQNGPPTGAPVVIEFYGNDLGDLSLAVERGERILSTIDGVRDISASTKSNATEIVLVADKGKAAEAGVSPQAIAQTLRSTVFGITGTTISKNGKDIDVIVKLTSNESPESETGNEMTLDMLKNLSVPTMKGGTVLLGTVVSERLAEANAEIVHKDEDRTASLSAYVSGTLTAQEAVTQFKSRERELELPEGIRISYGGETEDINKSFTEMGLALVAGLVLMLSILVLSFNSFRYALYLLLTVPLSLIGVFTGLTLAGLALSFTSLLGVIALAGVIINHAIILMDAMIHYRNAMPEDGDLIETVADASVTRLRPIVLTTITTVIGMVPLSTISDFWSPLAFAIMFGLSFAMILTLAFIPVLFYRNEKRRLLKKKIV